MVTSLSEKAFEASTEEKGLEREGCLINSHWGKYNLHFAV